MRPVKTLLVMGLWVSAITMATYAEQVPYGDRSDAIGINVEQAYWQLDSWRERRGHSPALLQLYQSYSLESLYQLTDSDSIYALQAAYLAQQEDDRHTAYPLLMRAAALDSTAALIMAGQSLENSLPLLAVAHYLVAALRGEVDLADIQVEQLVMRRGHSFTESQWQQIEVLTDLLMFNITSDRPPHMPAADWRYPDAYAEQHGLPRYQVSRSYLLQRWR